MRILQRQSLFLLPIAALILGIGACRDQLPTSLDRPLSSVIEDGSPYVTTDTNDYLPGDTVFIRGSGWTGGETVRLQITHANSPDITGAAYQPWDVTADENGNITSLWLVSEAELGAVLKLTADGQTSGGHAEMYFTDLIGIVRLYSDAGRTVSQSAYAWGTTVYPQLTGAHLGACYRIRWFDPSSTVQATTTFGPGSASYNATGFAIPATGPSGTWSVVVDQNTSANCAGPFISPTDPIFFDVARAVIIGAGTTGSDASGGDQCVYQANAPTGAGCSSATGSTMWVRSNSTDKAYSFIQFDLSSLPAGAVVSDATLRLMVAGTAGTALAPRSYEVQRANSAWGEGTIAWAGQPVLAPGSVAASATMAHTLTPTGGGDAQTAVRWTVTTDVQGFASGSLTNNGWRVSDVTAGNAAGRFFTTESAASCTGGTTCTRMMPVLLIDYTTVIPDNTSIATVIHSGDPSTDVAAGGVTSVPLGSTVHDKATVSNTGGGTGNGTPQGTVTFTFWTDATCGTNGGTSSAAGSEAVNGSGIAHPSTSKGPLAAGAYSFRASYTSSDESMWTNSTGDCEPLTVEMANTATTTQVHNAQHQDLTDKQIAQGSFVHDKAVVGTQVGSFTIGGTVTFEFFANRTCSGIPLSTEAVAVGTESSAQQLNVLGSYSYQATYNGDANYVGSEAVCEPFDIVAFGYSQGFWGNKNGDARIVAAGGYAANNIQIGRGATINSKAEATKVLPSKNACNKGSPQIFTVGGSTNNANCTLASGININSLNTLASQTLALGYNLKLVPNFSGQTLGILGCSAYLTAGLTASSTVDDAFNAAKALIDGSASGGTTTQSQIGEMNALLGGCINRDS